MVYVLTPRSRHCYSLHSRHTAFHRTYYILTRGSFQNRFLIHKALLIIMLKFFRNELLQEELDRWLKNYIDVNALVKKLLDAERANRKLREELSNLKDKFKTSEEERRRNTGIIERLRYELNSSCTDCNTTQEEIEEVCKVTNLCITFFRN